MARFDSQKTARVPNPYGPRYIQSSIRDLGRAVSPPGLLEAENQHLSVPLPAEAIHPLLTTKGDLLAFDTAQKRLAVGTNFRALIADSAAAEGLKWSDEYWLPNPYRREIGCIASINGGTSAIGGGTPALGGVHTQVRSADGTFLRADSGGAPNNQVGVNIFTGVDDFRREDLFRAFFRIRTHSDITSTRIVVGFASNANSIPADDATAHMAYFRYSTSVPDTNWQCGTNDNSGGGGFSDSGIVVAASTVYEFEIDCTAMGSVVFRINGTTVATRTTELPTSTASMGAVIVLSNLVAANRYIDWSKILVVER